MSLLKSTHFLKQQLSVVCEEVRSLTYMSNQSGISIMIVSTFHVCVGRAVGLSCRQCFPAEPQQRDMSWQSRVGCLVLMVLCHGNNSTVDVTVRTYLSAAAQKVCGNTRFSYEKENTPKSFNTQYIWLVSVVLK